MFGGVYRRFRKIGELYSEISVFASKQRQSNLDQNHLESRLISLGSRLIVARLHLNTLGSRLTKARLHLKTLGSHLT